MVNQHLRYFCTERSCFFLFYFISFYFIFDWRLAKQLYKYLEGVDYLQFLWQAELGGNVAVV